MSDIQQFLGQRVEVMHRDRNGTIQTQIMTIRDISYFPTYGECLVDNDVSIWLDRVLNIDYAISRQ